MNKSQLLNELKSFLTNDYNIIMIDGPWGSGKTYLLNEFINVNMGYYNEFFDNINENKHPEVEYLPQEMYEILDNAISNALSHATILAVSGVPLLYIVVDFPPFI